MNPNAKPFSFNPGASNWTPPSAAAPAPAPAPPAPVVPPPVPVVVEPKIELTLAPVSNTETEEVDDAGSDEIDENDPLWIAVLKLTKGDRKTAEKMLEDPDSLLQYPEIRAIMESADDAEEAKPAEDWETAPAAVAASPAASAPAAAAVAPSPKATKKDDSASPSKKSTAAQLPADEDAVEEVALQDDDPRNHLNLVFIGHVDAGKV